MDRITFIHSISGIQYPEMLINFFDQFLALYQTVGDFVTIDVSGSNDNSIEFTISFKNAKSKDQLLYSLQSGVINVYNKPVLVFVNSISDRELIIKLQQ